MLLISMAWLFVIYISPVPLWLVHQLESQYEVFDPSKIAVKGPVDILVLGGGSSLDPRLPAGQQLSHVALPRLIEGLRLHHELPDSRLVLSGHSMSGRTSVGELMALTSLELGVSPSDTLMLVDPGNTREEAEAYFSRFGETHTLILVTSASHMPRAMHEFRRLGLEPHSAPAGFLIHQDPIRPTFHFKPSLNKIDKMRVGIKENLGLLYASWKR